MNTDHDTFRTLTATQEFSIRDYDKLVEDFQLSFLNAYNFQENLRLHRNPQIYKQEILQKLYDLVMRIQSRPELQDFNAEKNAHSYVHIQVQRIWETDKRLRSVYNASKKYCEINGKNLSTVIIHIAE